MANRRYVLVYVLLKVGVFSEQGLHVNMATLKGGYLLTWVDTSVFVGPV